MSSDASQLMAVETRDPGVSIQSWQKFVYTQKEGWRCEDTIGAMIWGPDRTVAELAEYLDELREYSRESGEEECRERNARGLTK